MISRLFAATAALSFAGFATAPSITEYQIPRDKAFPHDPATGKITDVPTPTPESGPHGIVVAPDGMVWYTAQRAGLIGRLDPHSMQITEFKLPANANEPHTPLVVGKKIWFTAQTNNTY